MIDLKFDHVSKVYRIRHEDPDDSHVGPLQRKINSLRRGKQDFYAVRDVSFEVGRGEALGIIGRNGSGKSTMLKLLANITAPTAGEITVNGRLSALIEVGSGFHPELTGRENIYLSGSILGMRRREISAKLDSIIDFAGVEDFIDTPVKRFSSGMYVRLGFSIAAHLDPDILLLDEVLAVGDASFQAKCLKRIKELESAGTTIVFISHDLNAVERVCDRAILMHRGEVIASGRPREVIGRYAATSTQNESQGLLFLSSGLKPDEDFEVERVEALDQDGKVKTELGTGDYVRFRIIWRATRLVEDGGIEFGIHTLDGVPLINYSTRPVTNIDVQFQVGLNAIDLEFQQFPLAAGDYYLSIGLHRPMIEWLWKNERFALLQIKERDIFQSGYPLMNSYTLLAVQHKWLTSEVEGAEIVDHESVSII